MRGTEFSGASKTGARAVMGRAAAALLCWLALAGAGAATPEEDYARGEEAFAAGDVVTAMAALRRAADAGNAPAQVRLAQVLGSAGFHEEAVTYYRRAAEQGHAPGEFGLGVMYREGEGVAKDERQAQAWFERAAKRGHKPAVVELAQAIINNVAQGKDTGMEAGAALAWVRRAAELDYLPAVEQLASAYRTGGLGVQPDARGAQNWTTKAQELKKKQAGAPQKRRRQ